MGELKLDLEIQGMEELQEKLEKEALIGSPLKMLMGEAALRIERQVKIYSPVDTGRMRASIQPTVSKDPIPLWSKVNVNVDYASFVEYGGGQPRGAGRIPFFGPAIKEVKARIDSLLEQAKKMIEGEWQK